MTSESISSDQQPNSPQEIGAINNRLQPLPLTLPGQSMGQSSGPVTGWLHGKKPVQGQLSIITHQAALRKLEEHGRSNLEVELGGVLLGRVVDRLKQPTIEVSAALPVETSDHSLVHFTFTADTWAQLHRERGEKYPDLDVVGWYHTHPGLGVFFSADDVVVQTAAFVMPWHVALVFDPINKEGCFFGWISSETKKEGRELVALSGFWELVDDSNGTIAGWKYRKAATWPELPAIENPRMRSEQTYTGKDDWPLLPPINPWWGVLLGGLSLLISLLLLLDRLFAAPG